MSELFNKHGRPVCWVYSDDGWFRTDALFLPTVPHILDVPVETVKYPFVDMIYPDGRIGPPPGFAENEGYSDEA